MPIYSDGEFASNRMNMLRRVVYSLINHQLGIEVQTYQILISIFNTQDYYESKVVNE